MKVHVVTYVVDFDPIQQIWIFIIFFVNKLTQIFLKPQDIGQNQKYRAATWDLKNDIKVTGISLYQEVVQNIY